jgi:hypothetical protein
MPLLTKKVSDMAFGVDYSSSRPSHAALKTAGVEFAGRYIGSQVRKAGRDAKWLSPSEATALHSDGLDIVLIFETSAERADGGRAAGLADAKTAVDELAYCGAPANSVVFFAVDFDTTVGPLITGYFKAVAEVLGLARVGAYGGYRVIKALFDAHLITYGMQTYAWSAGKWDVRAQIQQYSNGRTIGGADVDYNRAMKPDFGQWPAKTVQPPAPKPKPVPAPPKWPGRYLFYDKKKPLMHGSDVEWVQKRLNAHGAKPRLAGDGVYGTHTRDEIEVFQKAHKLLKDGVVGEKTWTALGKS